MDDRGPDRVGPRDDRRGGRAGDRRRRRAEGHAPGRRSEARGRGRGRASRAPAGREARSPQGRVRGAPTGRTMALYRGSTIPEENLARAAEIRARLPGRRPPDRRPGGDCTEGSGRPGRHALDDRAGRPQRQGHRAACRRVRPGGELARPEFRRRPRCGAGGPRTRQRADRQSRQPAVGLLRLGEGPRIEGAGPAGAGAIPRTQGHEGRGGPEAGGPADDHPRRPRRRGRDALHGEGGHARLGLRLRPAPEAVRRGLPPRRGRAAV